MFRPLPIILAASVALLGATVAHAGTHWSVGINLPVPSVVLTNGGYYASEPTPVYYAPVPAVRYAPVYDAPPAYVAPRVVYSNEQPIYEAPYRAEAYGSWGGDRWERRREFERARWEHARHGREDERRGRGEHRRDDGDARRWHHD